MLLSVPFEFTVKLDFAYCGKLSFFLIANKYRKSYRRENSPFQCLSESHAGDCGEKSEE